MSYLLVHYLCDILKTQAEIIQKLQIILTQNKAPNTTNSFIRLLQILEHIPENIPSQTLSLTERAKAFGLPSDQITKHPTNNSNAYALLSSTVREFNLPETLEFHVWAFPHYRSWIEEAWNLELEFRVKTEPQAFHLIINETLLAGKKWVTSLSFPEEFNQQVEEVGETSWLRFRTRVLKNAKLRSLARI